MVKIMAWYTHWDPSFDLARGGIELSFRIHEDMSHLLVETEATRMADRIVEKIGTPSVSPRYHVIGTRGFGKSTLLNYMAFCLFTNILSQKVLPVYSTLLGTAKDEKDLEFVFFRSLLESLFDVPSDIEKFQLTSELYETLKQLTEAKVEYRKRLRDFGEVKLEYVFSAFKNQLEHLQKGFQKTVFLIDGLDKQETGIVLKFLRNTQEGLNNLVAKYNLVFVDSADPSWRETLGTKEFGGVRGIQIDLRGWTPEEVEALIRNRLEMMAVYLMPFERKALEMLVEDFQGNPREILQYCTTLLNFAATEHIRTIGPGLAREIVWTEESKEKFCKFIISDADARYAFDKLRTLYNERQTMNILIAAYGQKTQRLYRNLNYEARSSVGITLTDDEYKRHVETLLTKGCLKTSKIHDYTELESDIRKLFEFASSLGESLVALPVVLGTLESKVQGVTQHPKGEVIIKEEVQKIFEQNPGRWLDYKKCKELLFENPRTKGKIEEHFAEGYDRKVTQTIPLIVHSLLEDGKLIMDEETQECRWRTPQIEYETADFFRSKEILDLIESGRKAVAEGNLEKLTIMCKRMFCSPFEKLDALAGHRIDSNNQADAIDFLRDLDIEVEKPVSLNLYLQTLREPVANKSEADVYLQTAIMYAKRMFTKIHQLKNFEPRNQELIQRLKKCKTGSSKVEDREFFRRALLPILMKDYGRLVGCMASVKTREGVLETVPPELGDLLKNKQILPAEVYECPVCKRRTAIAAMSGDSSQLNYYCVDDKVPYDHKKSGYILSAQTYQSWNVWMEEYAGAILEKLPCKYVETGIMLKPLEVGGIASPEEVDAVLVFKGKSIAVECVGKVAVNDKKNDVRDILHKMEGLGLFDQVVLIYDLVEDVHAFNAEVKKHEKILSPVLVSGPKNFKTALLEALKKTETPVN